MSEGGPTAKVPSRASMFGQPGPLQAPDGAFLQEGHRLGVPAGVASSASEGQVVTESGRESSVVLVDLEALLADSEAYTASLLSKPMEVSPVIAKVSLSRCGYSCTVPAVIGICFISHAASLLVGWQLKRQVVEVGQSQVKLIKALHQE